MKNMKMEAIEKKFIFRTPGDPIEITDEMLENAEINPNELVDIILQTTGKPTAARTQT